MATYILFLKKKKDGNIYVNLNWKYIPDDEGEGGDTRNSNHNPCCSTKRL